MTRISVPISSNSGSRAAPAWTPLPVDEVARLLGGYEVLSLIGCGGMGAVYLALQTALDRPVAIKLLPLEVSEDEEFAQRFVQEARAMARLSHPHITPVFDSGKTAEGHLYYVMEFVDGQNLPALIGAGMKPEQALTIAAQVCEALECAHGQGIIHRDIKPANVLVDKSGRAKVTDFGIARLTDPGSGGFTLTHTGRTLGTPDYAAPEQVKGAAVDHRADIYSLGVMLYEMLCGEVPRGVFPRPSQRTDCGTRVDALVLKAMQQAPEQRYQSTTEMKSAMERVARQPRRNAPRWKPALVALLVLGVFAAAAFVWLPEKEKAVSEVRPAAPVVAVRSVPTRRETMEWFFRAGDSLSYLGMQSPEVNWLKVESLDQAPTEEYPIVDIWLDRLKSSQSAPPVMPEEFVRHMAGLTQLKTVFFRYHALLRDEHFAFLAANPQLETVTIEGMEVTDALLNHLKGLKNLRSLNISGEVTTRCRFTGRDLNLLACRASLQQFAVPGTCFDDTAAQHLLQFPALLTASLPVTYITDAALTALRQHPSLESLHLEGNAITDAGVMQLSSMKRLKRLAVSNLQESTLKALREALPGCKVGPQE